MDSDSIQGFLFPRHAPWKLFPAAMVALSVVGVVWGAVASGIGIGSGECDGTSAAFLILSILTSVALAVWSVLLARRYIQRAGKRSTHLQKLALNSPLSTMMGRYTILWTLLIIGWILVWIVVSLIASRAEPTNACKDQLRYLTSFYLVEVGIAVVLFFMTWVSEWCQKPNWKREAELEYFSREGFNRELEGSNRVLEREMANDPRYPQRKRTKEGRAADVGDSPAALNRSGKRVQFFDDPIGEGSRSDNRPRTATENTDARIAEMAMRASQNSQFNDADSTPQGPFVHPQPPSGGSVRTQYDAINPYSPVGSSVATRRSDIHDTPVGEGSEGPRSVQFAKANPMRDALNEAMKSKGHAAIAQRTLNNRLYDNSFRSQQEGGERDAMNHSGSGSGRRLTYDAADAHQHQQDDIQHQHSLLPEMSMNEAGYYLDLLGITQQSHRSLTGTESARSEEDLTQYKGQ